MLIHLTVWSSDLFIYFWSFILPLVVVVVSSGLFVNLPQGPADRLWLMAMCLVNYVKWSVRRSYRDSQCTHTHTLPPPPPHTHRPNTGMVQNWLGFLCDCISPFTCETLSLSQSQLSVLICEHSSASLCLFVCVCLYVRCVCVTHVECPPFFCTVLRCVIGRWECEKVLVRKPTWISYRAGLQRGLGCRGERAGTHGGWKTCFIFGHLWEVGRGWGGGGAGQ